MCPYFDVETCYIFSRVVLYFFIHCIAVSGALWCVVVARAIVVCGELLWCVVGHCGIRDPYIVLEIALYYVHVKVVCFIAIRSN